MEDHWRVFEARVLRPIVSGRRPVPLSDLCKEYHLKDESTASNMMITVKRRLKKALGRNMRRLGENSPTLSEQVEELLATLRN